MYFVIHYKVQRIICFFLEFSNGRILRPKVRFTDMLNRAVNIYSVK